MTAGFDYESAYLDAINHFPDGSTFVEVGCFRGKSLVCLAQRIKEMGRRIRVVGVEYGIGSGIENGNDNHAQAILEGNGTLAGILHKNLIDAGVADIVDLLITDSVRASRLFRNGSLDFVFLDARHDYQSVMVDILAWLPKMKAGGWIGGDDLSPVWPDVERAVRHVFGDRWERWSHDSFRHKVPDASTTK